MTIDQIPIWLDCDPGTDDAFAILLSLFHPKFKLLGVSTVYGNTDINQTTHNTLALMDILHKLVPVYRGENRPLQKQPRYAHYAHGTTGMGDVKLPEHPTTQECRDKPYHEAIRDAILAYRQEICLVVVGAYTNISLVFEKYPTLKSNVKLISMMGGAFALGNITPYAEFNVYADPKAANNLFHDEILMNKIIIVSLNLTHTAIATKQIRSKLFDGKQSTIRPIFSGILEFYYQHYLSLNKHSLGPPLHDPLAVFALLPMVEDPLAYKFDYVRRRVTVIESGEREGETVFVNGSKLSDADNEPLGCIVGKQIDSELFYDYLAVALDAADGIN